MADYHRLLRRQLRRHLKVEGDAPEPLREFIEAVSRSYRQMDEDRALLERSLEISSDELSERIEQATAQLEELRRVRDQVEHSLSRINATLEATADGILVVDLEGRVVDYNRRFAELWKIPQEILDRREDDKVLAAGLVQVADPEPFLAKVRQLYADLEAESFDIVEFKDGTVLERFSQPQRINGKPVGRVWSFSDATERRRNEEQLRRLTERLEAAQRIAHIGHWAWDLAADGVSCSREVSRIIGEPEGARFSMEALMARCHELDREPLRMALEWTRDHGDALDIEHRVVRPDGATRYVHQLGELERGEDGGELILATMHDITGRKQSEAQLRLARKVFETANEAIMITDTENRILEVNDAYCRITGMAREEVIGANPRVTSSGKHDKSFYAEMWKAILGRGEWSGEIWDRRKNGEIYPKWLSITALKDEDGRTVNYVGIFSDISPLREAQDRLQRLAYYDPLTELPNRSLFMERLESTLAAADREGFRFAVMYLDLDRFKYVNDSLGHAVGDELLKVVANRLVRCVRRSDTVARLGGDEFTIVLAKCGGVEDVGEIADKIIAEVAEPIHLEGHELYVEVSVGICVVPEDGNRVEDILKHADVAMYQAKEAGRGQYQFFSRDLQHQAHRHLSINAELRRALRDGEFEVHYQAQIESTTRQLVGMEALVRWRHPERGVVPPLEFIPVAEDTGLIIPIGASVLRAACEQNVLWQRMGLPKVPVAVNLSARQFEDEGLFEMVTLALEESGLEPQWLELEVTESVAMHDAEKTIAVLERFKAMGIHSSIDDFGTGYSSLAYLKRLPATKLKIDRSFVRDIDSDPNDAAIAGSVVRLADTMGLRVVAEGVEEQVQADMLQEMGCHYLQGYLFSRPVSAEKMADFLQRSLP